MLTELSVSNFRIFDSEITVRFRPITIFIGRNSSGKSSIIKFLLMLQQSTDQGNPRFLSTDGPSVSLGVFSQLKNSLTRKRSLNFRLVSQSDIRSGGWIPGLLSKDRDALLYRAKATVSYSGRTNFGSYDYSLVNQKSKRVVVRMAEKILDDSSFLDEQLPIKLAMHKAERTVSKGTTSVEFSMNDALAKHELISTKRHQLRSLRHLSPVRDESQRVITASNPPVDRVGHRGKYALPHLQQMVTEDHERYEFILPHLQRVAGIEAIRFETSSGYLSQAFARNKTTGADVLIADYGFGVSQCLPVFVQGALMPPYTSLAVEQPEAQLHPTAQLKLGSFFADLWTERKVGSIIETHSSNILLRLRRLIAKGDLSRRDVSVAFFTVDEENGNMPIVKNLDIDKDGSMQAGLPMEFFGADIIEGLNLGART